MRHDIIYSNALKLSKEVFRNIGYIFCYIYDKFTQLSIKDNVWLKECIKKIIDNNIDVTSDYYFYCNENGIDPALTKKTKIWKNLRKNYEMPPEFIFLINMFHRMETLDINIEFDGETLSDEDIKFFTITILNINYISPKLEHLNLNFIHNKLQFSLYKRYYTKIFNLLIFAKENIKKNLIKHHSLMYNIKWDFEHEFNLEEYRKMEISNEEFETNKIIYDDYSILCYSEEKNIKNESDGKRRIFNGMIHDNKLFSSTDNLVKVDKKDKNKIVTKPSLFKQNFDEFELLTEEQNDNLSSKTDSVKSKKIEKISKKQQKKEDNKKIYIELLEQNSAIFDIILMIICGVKRIESVKKINLLSNDFYNRDVINYMINNYGLDIASIDDEFHVLDMLYNKTNNLNLLNIEINSLDITSFDKIIGIIYKNQSLNSLKLSFFSADVSYFIVTLLKVYEHIKKNEEIANYVLNEGKNFDIDKFEQKILNDISPFFVDNLYLLFEIIKNKNNLEVLGLNFDLPNILINNMNYKISIFKFILNIIFLIDNKEIKNINKIKKLTLLSPYTIFDNRIENNIDLILKDILIYKNCKVLEELNIQFKFYNMSYLKNLISPNLTILRIGDLDLISFDKLVNYLTSYNFSSKSALTNLNLKLLSIITSFNTEIKNILRKLFDIKIKCLLELKLYTNIIIENKANCAYLIKILNNNWIPSYTITFNENEKTQELIHYFFGKEVFFIASDLIGSIIYKTNEEKEKCKSQNQKSKRDESEDIFWMLNYIFKCNYLEHSLSFFEIKNLIFTITKYLYSTSNVKLSHKIEDEK